MNEHLELKQVAEDALKPKKAPWIVKAESIIQAFARQAYVQANQLPDGRMRKKYVPYTLPQEALDLHDCVKRNDEQRAKSLMMHDYAIEKLRDATRL